MHVRCMHAPWLRRLPMTSRCWRTPDGSKAALTLPPVAHTPVPRVTTMPTPTKRLGVRGPKGKRPNGYKFYTAEELRLLAQWVDEGRSPTEVADLLARDLSSVVRRMKQLASGGVPSSVPPRLSRLCRALHTQAACPASSVPTAVGRAGFEEAWDHAGLLRHSLAL